MLTKASFAVLVGPQKKNSHRKEKQSEGGGGLVPNEGQRQAELSSVGGPRSSCWPFFPIWGCAARIQWSGACWLHDSQVRPSKCFLASCSLGRGLWFPTYLKDNWGGNPLMFKPTTGLAWAQPHLSWRTSHLVPTQSFPGCEPLGMLPDLGPHLPHWWNRAIPRVKWNHVRYTKSELSAVANPTLTAPGLCIQVRSHQPHVAIWHLAWNELEFSSSLRVAVFQWLSGYIGLVATTLDINITTGSSVDGI